MKLHHIACVALLGAALSATRMAANSVVLKDTGFNGSPYAGAGEFLAITSDDGKFVTFCLEHNVGVRLNTKYSYTIDDAVLNQNDKLSWGSAWLYSAFVHGTLSGPTGNGTYTGGKNSIHDTNAGYLQKAFWMLEDEIAYDSSNYYVGLVESIFGANVKANYGGTQVKVLNIWGKDSRGKIYDVQSQLFYVPDSGMTAALLGIGLFSLAALRRKF